MENGQEGNGTLQCCAKCRIGGREPWDVPDVMSFRLSVLCSHSPTSKQALWIGSETDFLAGCLICCNPSSAVGEIFASECWSHRAIWNHFKRLQYLLQIV
ncbi:hypothetical protein SKAU_G00160840 [Synaphobranchus kaupii]|uniref:Uncharacterized protein n=1 Tax=Synaphobranchus kaupii TaxID=118154 RepID=A0A9Q1FIX3_SYNKA|nr:hypothetical protein SKAU_G00160840 [Synaphobranchus kaupii]